MTTYVSGGQLRPTIKSLVAQKLQDELDKIGATRKRLKDMGVPDDIFQEHFKYHAHVLSKKAHRHPQINQVKTIEPPPLSLAPWNDLLDRDVWRMHANVVAFDSLLDAHARQPDR